MYDLGVRDFGVLVDDSSGEIGKAERQVQLCNYILEHFIRKHADVNQTLIMCPTGYNKAWTNEQFLQTLGNGLDRSIPVMWTGDTVVNDITLSGQKWVNKHVKRPTFIWWNWPCNDFKRSRISMGRTYGLETAAEMKNEMSGFVANPMEHAEASKIGLFGVADYTWNITGFESDKSWRAGIARLYPDCTKAMQCFCDHNSYLLPNTHKYLREESVQFAPISATYRKSLHDNAPNTVAAATLQNEFKRMEHAGITLWVFTGLDGVPFFLSSSMSEDAFNGVVLAEEPVLVESVELVPVVFLGLAFASSVVLALTSVNANTLRIFCIGRPDTFHVPLDCFTQESILTPSRHSYSFPEDSIYL